MIAKIFFQIPSPFHYASLYPHKIDNTKEKKTHHVQELSFFTFDNSNMKPKSAYQRNHQGGKAQGRRKSKSTTSPRTGRNKTKIPNKQSRQVIQWQGGPKHSSSSDTSSEPSPIRQLKTALRQSSFLYEKDTSQAIILMAWLVGRSMSLRNGYFYRKDMTKGVHAVVAPLIDSGFITTTRVNRCLQLVLKSSFDYILPRQDGIQACGSYFSTHFSLTVSDVLDDEANNTLLNSLPSPWRDLDFTIAANTEAYAQPHGNDMTRGEMEPVTVDTENRVADKKVQTKPPVLMCFVDNVRSLKCLLRNHDERIRDVADEAKLHLTEKEWSSFFSGKTDEDSHGRRTLTTMSDSDTSTSSPSIKGEEGWGNGSSFIFEISTEVSDDLTNKGKNPGSGETSSDINAFEERSQYCRRVPGTLDGLLEPAEFRTVWCCKPYKHDIDKCTFAHKDVNGGWLRRDPRKYDYRPQLCSKFTIGTNNINECVYKNFCTKGQRCEFAHSEEENFYHPNNYKNIEFKCLPCDNSGPVRFSPSSVIVPQELEVDKTFDRARGIPIRNTFDKAPGADLFNRAPGAPIRKIESDPGTDYVKENLLPYLNSGFSFPENIARVTKKSAELSQAWTQQKLFEQSLRVMPSGATHIKTNCTEPLTYEMLREQSTPIGVKSSHGTPTEAYYGMGSFALTHEEKLVLLEHSSRMMPSGATPLKTNFMEPPHVSEFENQPQLPGIMHLYRLSRDVEQYTATNPGSLFAYSYF